MSRPLFPLAVDSTIIGTFRSCPQKAFRSYIEHWKPREESVHLIAGGAFAAGIEAARRAFYEDGAPSEVAVGMGLESLLKHYGDFECPPESAKSPERVCGALEFYFANYPLGEDGATPVKFGDRFSGIEFSFAHPLPISHPVSGDPILYTGRADMLAEAFGGVYVFDEKTASSLGPSWAKQWDMRSQFTGYSWAAREYGIPTQGVVIRGVSILKTKYDTQQAITYRADWEIDRWLEQVCRDLERMIKCWEEGYWDWNLDHACTEYAGCPLTMICKSPNPDTWLESYFHRRVWDPLLREEISVEDYEARQR